MLTLLLALTAAQPTVRAPPQKSVIEQYIAPRFRWSRSDGRYTPGDAPLSEGVSYAFFEAFPTSGAGAGTSCPVANWVKSSEDTSSATYWQSLASGTVSPTFVNGTRTDPSGGVTADEWTFYAQSSAAGTYALRAAQNNIYTACGVGQVCTHSIWMQWVSGGTSLSLCTTDSSAVMVCEAKTISSTWTKFTITAAGTGANYHTLGFGMPKSTAFGSNVTVRVAFAQTSPGPAVGTYYATTTAAVGVNPTGARGETLTFARTGDATCSKSGLATTGIADGDLVRIPANYARVEPDADGVLGLRVEGARTNYALRSQELDNASWTASGTGAAAPTVTGNYATAPDGTLTAERLQVAACPTVGNQSVVFQNTAAGAASAYAVYLKAVSGTPSVTVCGYNGSAGVCATCALNTSTWTRCATATGAHVSAQTIVIGCNNATAAYSGASNTGVADILAWQADVQAGSYITSPIPTVAAAVTRNGEIAYFANSFGTQLASGSMCASVQHMGGEADKGWLTLSAGDSFRTMLYQGAAADAVNLYVSAASKASRTTTAGQRSLVGYWSGAGTGVCVDGTCTTGTGATESATITRLRLLTYSGDADASRVGSGIISRVKVDPDVTRCGP